MEQHELTNHEIETLERLVHLSRSKNKKRKLYLKWVKHMFKMPGTAITIVFSEFEHKAIKLIHFLSVCTRDEREAMFNIILYLMENDSVERPAINDLYVSIMTDGIMPEHIKMYWEEKEV